MLIDESIFNKEVGNLTTDEKTGKIIDITTIDDSDYRN
nr:MAG TPA: hypothetical protein [Bacteriophage sp.]